MASKATLKADDREFFRAARDAAFANPFGEARHAIDRKLARAGEGLGREALLDRLVDAIADRLPKGIDLRRYDSEDRALLEPAVLFEVFHRHAAAIDAHIRDQLASPSPVRAPFGRAIVHTLSARGVSSDEALRYAGIFFQMRRAFYFIEGALPGGSGSMRALREALWNDVFTCDVALYARFLWRRMEDFSTFLLGETGTGKGAAASAIGRSGFIPYDLSAERFAESFGGAFVAINLSQFPESLLESELFGHRKGAFTGAIEAHRGVFERCSPHGAIFLDEIGEIDEPVQVKLLHVLQDRVFTPVGGHTASRFAGRVIAATNRSLTALRENGRFRDDFYYRLCSDVIVLPTLRARLREDPAELTRLVSSILRRIVGDDAASLVPLVEGAIVASVGRRYAWPGNVRELEQCVRRILLTRRYASASIDRAIDDDARLLAACGDGEDDIARIVARYCRALYDRHGTYEEVARRTKLDRRTVKRYVTLAQKEKRGAA